MDRPPRVVPPVYLLGALILILALARWAPVRQLLRPPAAYLGLLPIALGVLLVGAAVARFRRVGTGLRPGSEPTVLVREGPYRFSRNPMYLGMTLVLIGAALLTGALSALPVPLLFLALVHTLFVRKEERRMEDAFGEVYRAYRRRTRRWI